MATTQEISALVKCFQAARAANHIYPNAAACEGAVETGTPNGGWFTSQSFLHGNNVFGMKQHAHPMYGTVNLPTREFLGGKWKVINADFIAYPDLPAAFADRMATLVRLQDDYPHYKAALAAKTPEDYLTQVSMTWSTGPSRGADCISILHAHGALLV